MRSTFPVHGTRMILMFEGYVSRMEPARSAAVYPQKLQQNEMMIGSNGWLIGLLRSIDKGPSAAGADGVD